VTPMKQLLQFTDNKTYFGVDIYRYGVKVDNLVNTHTLNHPYASTLGQTKAKKYS